MFSSRRRAQSNPPLKTAPTAAAATAAAQAFLANRASNVNLAAAAAGAALRSHTTTPTPVGEIQTKRMQQRWGSSSSNGSAPGRPTLQRRGSSGSLTERTFRDPSPSGRPGSRSRDEQPPPMPPIPKNYASPQAPRLSIQRPASVEPPHRVSSPPPRAPRGRGVSLDRGPGLQQPAPKAKSRSEFRDTSLRSSAETPQSVGGGPVNFSRPMSPSNSPPISPSGGKKPALLASRQAVLQQPANPVSVLSRAEREHIEKTLRGAADIPIKKKKKILVPAVTDGSHLPPGGSGERPVGTTLEETYRWQPGSSTSTPSPASTNSQPRTQNQSPLSTPSKTTRTAGPKRDSQERRNPQGIQQGYGSDSDTVSDSERPRKFNTRAAGLLTKQPSIVREDREAEELEERGAATARSNGTITKKGNVDGSTSTRPRSKGTTNLPNEHRNIESADRPRQMQTSKLPSQQTQVQLRTLADNPKRASLSPSRAAHFLMQPSYEIPDGAKHQPLPRSVSPAKSALKSSPSIRGASPGGLAMPGGWSNHAHAPSEASDTGSVVSEDGYRSVSKRKTARVSFDDEPVVVVGRSATPPSGVGSPVLISPQSKDAPKRGWLNLGHSGKKESDRIHQVDDVIQPVPTLPSFGSIRGRQKFSDDAILRSGSPQVRETAAPADSLETTGISSDHAISGIIVHDIAQRNTAESTIRTSNDPLPPEVTSVEGSGYHSDSGSNNGQDDQTGEQTQAIGVELTGANISEHQENDQERIPTIAVLPATPKIDGLTESTREWLGVPRGPLMSRESPSRTVEPLQSTEYHPTERTLSTMGIAEPEPESMTGPHNSSPPVVGVVAESLRHQTSSHRDNDSDDSGDSIYSDAAEDVSEMEGDGFGSIDAVVESPTSTKFPLLPQVPASTVQHDAPFSLGDGETGPRADAGWDKAQAYWAGLSNSQKLQMEKAASPAESDQNVPSPVNQPARKKEMTGQTTNTSVRAEQRDLPTLNTQIQNRTTNSAAGSQLKQLLRGQVTQSSEPPRRPASMRADAPLKSAFRQSAPGHTVLPSGSPEPRGTLQKKLRPVSAVAIVNYSSPPGGTNNSRITSASSNPKKPNPAAAPKKKPPVLTRNISNGSDSSSSFKRARPASSDGSRYTMRRSMRSSIDERPKSAMPNQYQPPTTSNPQARRPISTGAPGMRTTMRSSVGSGDRSGARSPTRSLGFGREAKSKPRSAIGSSRFSSRFRDSSDEDEPSRAYSSRYQDSSDEEGSPEQPKGLAPVRGIPRRVDEGDSTDLEEERIPSNSKKPAPLGAPTPKFEGAALASGSLRPSRPQRNTSHFSDTANMYEAKITAGSPAEKKKRSFFSGLGRRKDKSQTAPAHADSAAPRKAPPLERSPFERAPALLPEVVAVQSPASSETARPPPPTPTTRSPKLQRRHTPKRFASDSWPLPPSPAAVPGGVGADERPYTSDGGGVGGQARPGIGSRRGTGQAGLGNLIVNSNVGAGGVAGLNAKGNANADVNANANANGVVGEKGGKKRRFPLLRRALGLHD